MQLDTPKAREITSTGTFPGIRDTVLKARSAFETGRTRSYEWRIQQLDALLTMLKVEEQRIVEALVADVGKRPLEAWAAEVSDIAGAVRHLRKNLKKYMKPERVGTPMLVMPGKSSIVREPLGVVLIISPWNYPFALAANPLAGAIAAGNCVVIKPSEVAPRTSAIMAELLPRYLDADCVHVVEGSVAETTALLEHRFDHILYTGNGTVGRIVMTAAAKHLTPVTLELGGKSPVIVDEHADVEVTARRLVWGKFYNCGQTCVGPDYVLATAAIHDRLVEAIKSTILEFWGPNPQQHPDYGRVVNVRHHRRLMSLLPGSGRIAMGGVGDEADRCYIAPTLLVDVPPDSPVMRDEIFGPIMPVLKVRDLEQAIHFVNERAKPLAMYLFSGSSESQRLVMENTSSGGLVINHAILHVAVPDLPFGGVGESGMGAYHGKHSFETFSHRRAVLKKPTLLDPSLLYPPYTDSKKTWMRRLV